MYHKPSWAYQGPAWPNPAAPIAMSGIADDLKAKFSIKEKRIGNKEWYAMFYAVGITALSYFVWPPTRSGFRTSVVGASAITMGAYAFGRVVFWPGRDEVKMTIQY